MGSTAVHRQPTIDELTADKAIFNKFVYTPLHDAVNELHRRRTNKRLAGKIKKFLNGDLPRAFKTSARVVLARHIVTPNHEVIRFLSVADTLGIKPLFFEYYSDKMIFKNPWKYSLGRLSFHAGQGRKRGAKLERLRIIHFDNSHGKQISSVKTLWDEYLVDFHHKLLLHRFPLLKRSFFDGSEWYAAQGKNPLKFYDKFLSLFLYHGILFDNFFLDKNELAFTKEVFLPAFIKIQQEFGIKPLIVHLEPFATEEDEFWLSYPHSLKSMVEDRLKKSISGVTTVARR